ncbi:kinase-like domain-containing protein [Cladorrhinum sp. PSN332]|nr:kinase-like domain-containing protein [Cladorrhinum sp. PSN332]
MARTKSDSIPPHDLKGWGANCWNCHLYHIRRRGVSVENANQYHRGGFHPIIPGDLLGDNARFRVVHKLGVGGFGTVWLCRDNQEQKWRALKVLAARKSEPDESVELALTKYFQENNISHADLMQAHVAMPLEYFWIEGPNGKHQVQVLELLGPHLGEFFKLYARSRAIIKDTCVQLVDALDFLHSNRICHGDFRPENIMVQLISEIHDWSEEELLDVIGKPDHVVVFRRKETREDGSEFDTKWDAGVPQYLIPPANFDFGSGICAKEIAVSDFGVAYTFSRPQNGPPSYFKYAAEMETYMGPMPKNYQRALKADGYLNEVEIDEEDDTSYMSMLGPRDWYQGTMWEKVTSPPKAPTRLSESEIFTSPSTLSITPKMAYQIALQDSWDTQHLPEYKPSRNILNKHLKDEYRANFEWRDREEVDKLADLLQSMLKWTPEARPPTGELMSHPWFNIEGLGGLDDFTEEEKAYWSSMGATAADGVEPEALRRQRPRGKRSKQRQIKRDQSKRKESRTKQSRRRGARRRH